MRKTIRFSNDDPVAVMVADFVERQADDFNFNRFAMACLAFGAQLADTFSAGAVPPGFLAGFQSGEICQTNGDQGQSRTGAESCQTNNDDFDLASELAELF